MYYPIMIHPTEIDSALPSFEEKNSPFALYKGETVKNYVPSTSWHTNIDEIDQLIICQINTYRILTSTLLHQILQRLGKILDEIAVKQRLRKLADAQFLTKTEFFTNRGTAAICCYSVGYRGRGLLKALSVNQRLTGYISELCNDPIRIKKILSANQFLIRTGVSSDNIEVCQTVLSQQKFKKDTDYIFRPQAIVQEGNTRIIESVRQNELWKAELTDKLDRMEATFKRKESNIPLVAPSVTLIAENASHLKELIRLIMSCNYHFPIVFTCDTLIYRNPQNCTYQLEEDRSFSFLFKKVIGF